MSATKLKCLQNKYANNGKMKISSSPEIYTARYYNESYS